jgi:hypothetical protein
LHADFSAFTVFLNFNLNINPMKTCSFKLALTAALVSSAVSAMATDFKLADGVEGRISGTATFGTIIRIDDPNPANYALIPSSVVAGATPGQLVGQTGGSDLNFSKGHAVSTVAKAMVDLDVHGKNLGLFLRADAWDDLVQGHDSVAYGNFPNGFKPNTPLSDKGFAADAKFSNARIRDGYLYGKFSGDDGVKAEVRVGAQVLNWGVSQFFNGGVGAATNPQDLAAQFRPGALSQESKVPVGMISLSLSSGKDWGFDGFLPYESRTANMPGCGSFFDTVSIVQPGCNFAAAITAPAAGTPLSTIASLTEQAVLASGIYVRRNPDGNASGAGQLGLSLRYNLESWNTEIRGYLTRTSNTLPNIYRATIENVNGATLPPGLAGGLARLTNPNGVRYSVIYPEGVNMLGASFDTKLDATSRVFGEVAYRPNQPLGMSPLDMLTAALLRAPTSLLATQMNFLATPAGGNFDGYDRFGVTTANLGANKVFAKALGAERVILAGELGFSHVDDLPDPSVMRYGRGLAYGAAPYLLNGALTPCAETAPGLSGVPGKTCTTDGYISPNAWGLRGRVSAMYANALFGAALTPSLTLAKDVKGYSYDSTFSEGRLTARLALRADWGKAYFGEVAYTYYGGGKYNLMSDRSNLGLVGGVNF